jgi:hypothetical protein
MSQVSFDYSGIPLGVLDVVVRRAAAAFTAAGYARPALEIRMDLVVTHANGNPMDFERLAEADDFNFAHDVFGIYRHLDRETGKLGDCFLPRFTMKKGAAA